MYRGVNAGRNGKKGRKTRRQGCLCRGLAKVKQEVKRHMCTLSRIYRAPGNHSLSSSCGDRGSGKFGQNARDVFDSIDRWNGTFVHLLGAWIIVMAKHGGIGRPCREKRNLEKVRIEGRAEANGVVHHECCFECGSGRVLAGEGIKTKALTFASRLLENQS